MYPVTAELKVKSLQTLLQIKKNEMKIISLQKNLLLPL